MVCICFLLDGITYGQKSKFHGKKQPNLCKCIVQFFKIWFQSNYCGRKSTVEIPEERKVAKKTFEECQYLVIRGCNTNIN